VVEVRKWVLRSFSAWGMVQDRFVYLDGVRGISPFADWAGGVKDAQSKSQAAGGGQSKKGRHP
jgi:hypothetical protein